MYPRGPVGEYGLSGAHFTWGSSSVHQTVELLSLKETEDYF